MKTPVSSLEYLENRIAPSSFNAFGYTESDGDHVTVQFSKNILTLGGNPNLVSFNDDGSLDVLDLTTTAAPAGTGITFSVIKGARGDGIANVGYIKATGIDLGAVIVKGDLGQIDAGTDSATIPAVKSLAVRSMGRLGLDTQGQNPSSLQSDILGRLGALTVAGDMKDVFLTLPGAHGSIGNIVIGGSLIGGATNNAGEINVSGSIGAVKIGHDVQGSSGVQSGVINLGGKMTSLTIGGSLIGGSGAGAGAITAVGGIGPVTIAHNIQGGTNTNTGVLSSGSGALGAITVVGSLLGGAGDHSGEISSTLSMGAVRIGADLRGGAGSNSGHLASSGPLTSLTIGGSLIGGSGSTSGALEGGFMVGPVRIAHDLVGASITGTASSSGSGFITGGHLAGVTIGGSIISGTDDSSGSLSKNATIRAQADLVSLTVTGSLVGNSGPNGLSPVIISAAGQDVPGATTDVAIGKITIGGRVEWSKVLAGFDPNLNAANADAQVGPVSVRGDWTASSLAAGALAGPNGYGSNDTKQTGVKDSVAISSKIASVTIGGLVFGTPDSGGVNVNDRFGFVAEQIGAVKIGGVASAIPAGQNTRIIGQTYDVNLHLIP